MQTNADRFDIAIVQICSIKATGRTYLSLKRRIAKAVVFLDGLRVDDRKKAVA